MSCLLGKSVANVAMVLALANERMDTHIQTFPDTSEQKALKTLVFRVASPLIRLKFDICCPFLSDPFIIISFSSQKFSNLLGRCWVAALCRCNALGFPKMQLEAPTPKAQQGKPRREPLVLGVLKMRICTCA